MTIFYYKKHRWISCICIIAFIFTCLFVSKKDDILGNENLNMYSQSYALSDGDTGRVLTGKNEDVPMANASTTKILTCIIILECSNLEDMVTISSNAASQPKVRLGVKEGETYPIKDLLYGLMLESYNDCAVALAEHLSKSVENFADVMNAKAKKIGCKNTYFITPNGLDAEDNSSFHHTTAEDLCRIMAYCTWESPQKEQFLEITQTRNYAGKSNGREYSFINHNALLDQMDGVLTGKTGFTNKAGYCYVAAFEKDNERYCIALLACGWPNNKNYKWKDARILLEYGFKTYDKKHLTLKSTIEEMSFDGVVGNVVFEKINTTDILYVEIPKKDYEFLVKEGEELILEQIYNTDMKLPIKKGQKLGICNVYLDDVCVDSFSIDSYENVNIWGWKEILYTIFYQFLTFYL